MRKIPILVAVILSILLITAALAACTGESYEIVDDNYYENDAAGNLNDFSEDSAYSHEYSTPQPEIPISDVDSNSTEPGDMSTGPDGETFSFPFSFLALDLQGNQISETTLGDKELFFVYFWTTWCPACVRSIPGLASLAEEFDDRVGFLSLLGDFADSADNAVRIKQAANAQFYTIDAINPDLLPLLELLDSGFVPTTVLIGADGNVIGEMIVGSSMDIFRSAIEDALLRD